MVEQSGLDLGPIVPRPVTTRRSAIAVAPAPKPRPFVPSPIDEAAAARPASVKVFNPTITPGFVVASWSGPFRPESGVRCITCKGTRFWSPWPKGRGMLCRYCKSPDAGQAIAEAIDTAAPIA